MNLKSKFRIIIGALFAVSSLANAENEGMSLFYGVGAGIVKINDSALNEGLIANFTLGIEEKGWAVEFSALGSTQMANTVDSTAYTTLSGSSTTLSYKTVEKKGKYYKLKYGSMDMEFTDKFPTGSTTLTTEGITYGAAVGWRVNRDERIELGFDVYDTDDISSKVHMINLNVLFGGDSGRGVSRGDNPFYFGLFAGSLNNDDEFLEDPIAYGLLAGFDLTIFGATNFAFEFIYTDSRKAEVDGSPDETFEDSAIAFYGVYKLPVGDKLYGKLSLGYASVYTKESDLGLDDEYYSEAGPSAGLAVGFKLDDGSMIELGYTIVNLDYNGLKLNPSTITVGYIF